MLIKVRLHEETVSAKGHSCLALGYEILGFEFKQKKCF